MKFTREGAVGEMWWWSWWALVLEMGGGGDKRDGAVSSFGEMVRMKRLKGFSIVAMWRDGW